MATDDNTAIPLFLNLALVTLADSLASNALEVTTSPSTAPKPGFWNIGTTNIILSGVTGTLPTSTLQTLSS
jgi:hypothetical protein